MHAYYKLSLAKFSLLAPHIIRHGYDHTMHAYYKGTLAKFKIVSYHANDPGEHPSFLVTPQPSKYQRGLGALLPSYM